jgi:hypothetical protein
MLSAMPSRRSAIEVSPRRPSSTMRIFSSAAWCFRVARRMLRTSISDDAGVELDFVSSSLLEGYDEPEILRSSSRQFCLTGVEAGQIHILAHIARQAVYPELAGEIL